jgi:hypothetical protein
MAEVSGAAKGNTASNVKGSRLCAALRREGFKKKKAKRVAKAAAARPHRRTVDETSRQEARNQETHARTGRKRIHRL